MTKLLLTTGGVLALCVGLAQAATVNGIAELPSDTDGLITFNDGGFINGTEITDQFRDEGAVFSGLFYDDGFSGRENTDGALLYRFGRGVTAGIQFTTNVSAAYFAIGSAAGSATFTSYLAGELVESFTASIDGTGFPERDPRSRPNVFGFEGSVFDEIRFTNAGNSTGFSFDNLAFNEAPSPVPLPAGLPLLLAGLGAFGVMRRRQKAQDA